MRYIIVFILSSLFLIACSSNQQVVKEEAATVSDSREISLDDRQLAALALEFGDMTSAIINSEINVQGRIDLPPQNLISVNFPLGGYLRSTKLIPGMHVSKGEVIAIMEDQSIVQLQQDYLQSVARLQLAGAELDRQKVLYQASAGTSKAYQQAEAEFSLQSINVKSLSEKLKLISIDPARLSTATLSGQVPIYSTINGFVSKVNVNTGKYVQATETIFELIDPDDIHAALTIFEKDLPFVKKGNSVTIRFNENRTAIAHCHFRNQPQNLLPGMFVEGSISLNHKNVNSLPEDALVFFGNQHYAYFKKGKSVIVMIPVEVGGSMNGKVEIVKGLEQVPKGSLVLNNAYKLFGLINNRGEE